MLTLPLCGLLKTQLGAEVVMLARGYTRPVLEASPFVDEILDWDDVAAEGADAQRAFMERARADVVLHVFPRRDIARAARDARIPLRIGTSHRVYHWLTCNALEHFGRRGSALHEAQLNVRLARRLLGEAIPSLAELAPLTRVVPRVNVPADVDALIDPTRAQLVLHPGSNGSGREWPLDYWKALAESVDPSRVQLLVSGSREEGERLRSWISTLPSRVVDLTGRLELAELIALLAKVDGMVAAGTGPLHIAAAAGARTLGLFPPTPPIHPGRWAPQGPHAEFLTAPAACAAHGRAGDAACGCMRAISVAAVFDRIAEWTRPSVRDPGYRMRPSVRRLPATASI